MKEDQVRLDKMIDNLDKKGSSLLDAISQVGDILTLAASMSDKARAIDKDLEDIGDFD